MIFSKTLVLSTAAAVALAAFSHSALAGSGKAKRLTPSAQVQMSAPKPTGPGALQGNGGGATQARECTWTNDNVAECTEWKGDTVIFTCFDHNGNSIGC